MAPRPRPRRDRPHPLVRLVFRLVVAQAVVAGAVGLPFSRRHAGSVIITLSLVAGFCLLAFAVRAGTRTAWASAVIYESAFFGYGLAKFVAARYVGGTLFALVIAGTLLHPAVARAYGVPLRGRRRGGRAGLGDAAGETVGGRAAG
jgi:hypothetical protein